MKIIFSFTSCKLLLVSEVCFNTGNDILVSTEESLVSVGKSSVFTVEIGEASFLDVTGNVFVLFGDGDLLLPDSFDIFFTFDFALAVVSLISSALPSGLVRIISKRSFSDICLMPKLRAYKRSLLIKLIFLYKQKKNKRTKRTRKDIPLPI